VAGAVLTVGALGFAGMLEHAADREATGAAPAPFAPSTARIVAAATPGVVAVTAQVGASRRRASGIAVAPRYVVTDAAAVTGASALTVTVGGAPPVEGKLVGLDADTGLALLEVDATIPVLPAARSRWSASRSWLWPPTTADRW